MPFGWRDIYGNILINLGDIWMSKLKGIINSRMSDSEKTNKI
jgi:hypothetical protein